MTILQLGADYVSLLRLREQVLQEVDAMRVIVATAAMNPQVLMHDVLLKQKKVLVRIDSTPEGRQFLLRNIDDDITTPDIKQLTRRLRVGNALNRLRKTVNDEFVTYQNGWNRFPVGEEERVSTYKRFLLGQKNKCELKVSSLLTISSEEAINTLVHLILIDEIDELLASL